jgi:hypothetical protein
MVTILVIVFVVIPGLFWVAAFAAIAYDEFFGEPDPRDAALQRLHDLANNPGEEVTFRDLDLGYTKERS